MSQKPGMYESRSGCVRHLLPLMLASLLLLVGLIYAVVKVEEWVKGGAS